MKVKILALYSEACQIIDEVFGDKWREEREAYDEDDVKVYDVTLNLEYVTLEVDGNVWLKGAEDGYVAIDSRDYLSIVVR